MECLCHRYEVGGALRKPRVVLQGDAIGDARMLAVKRLDDPACVSGAVKEIGIAKGDVLGASQSGSRSSLKLLRVLKDADLIAQARTLAEQCIAQNPELSDAGLADIVTDVEMDAAGDWLERS